MDVVIVNGVIFKTRGHWPLLGVIFNNDVANDNLTNGKLTESIFKINITEYSSICNTVYRVQK